MRTHVACADSVRRTLLARCVLSWRRYTERFPQGRTRSSSPCPLAPSPSTTPRSADACRSDPVDDSRNASVSFCQREGAAIAFAGSSRHGNFDVRVDAFLSRVSTQRMSARERTGGHSKSDGPTCPQQSSAETRTANQASHNYSRSRHGAPDRHHAAAGRAGRGRPSHPHRTTPVEPGGTWGSQLLALLRSYCTAFVYCQRWPDFFFPPIADTRPCPAVGWRCRCGRDLDGPGACCTMCHASRYCCCTAPLTNRGAPRPTVSAFRVDQGYCHGHTRGGLTLIDTLATGRETFSWCVLLVAHFLSEITRQNYLSNLCGLTHAGQDSFVCR